MLWGTARCLACSCMPERSYIKCTQRPTEAHARTYARTRTNDAHQNPSGQTSKWSTGWDGASGGTLIHGEVVHHRGVGIALLVDVHGDAKDVQRCEQCKIERSPCVCWPAGRSRALAGAFGVVLGCTRASGRRAGACVPARGPCSSALTAGRNRRSLRGRVESGVRAAPRGRAHHCTRQSTRRPMGSTTVFSARSPNCRSLHRQRADKTRRRSGTPHSGRRRPPGMRESTCHRGRRARWRSTFRRTLCS